MKWLVIISGLCLFVGSSCRTIRSTSSSERERITNNITDKSHYEQLYYMLRDSVVNIKAPQERSESRGLQRSELETSLARSTAEVDSSGVLSHNIENKDSIPSKIVYRDRYHTKSDTCYINRSDTVRLTETEYVEKGLTAVQKFQIKGFWVLAVCILVFIALKLGKQPIRNILKIIGKWIGL